MSFWKLAPYAAGGVALSALENQVLGANIPDPLKKINLGIGLTQGAMFGMPGENSKMLALGSIPAKQMALFGLGEAEKFKNQQQALTDTNLNTAKVNESAAKLHLRDAGSSRAIQLAFLIPALVGAGALGYNAYNEYRKSHKPKTPFKNISETGEHKPNQKIRMEIPLSSLPEDFVPSILSARDRSHVMVKQRQKAASTFGSLGNLGNIAMDFTGLPLLARGGKDLMNSYGSLQDSDYHNSARYLGAGLGGLAMGAAALRWNAPLAARLLGKARLSGVIRNAVRGESSQLTEAPTAARYLYRHGFMHDFENKPRTSLTSGTLPGINAYDPMKYDWKSPTTSSGLFRGLLTAPPPGAGPKSLLGTLGMGARYAGNRAVNAGYAGKQLMKRWPNASLTAAGIPFVNTGTVRDEEQDKQQQTLYDKYIPHEDNIGPMGMPVSSVANSILRALSGSPEPISRQLSGI